MNVPAERKIRSIPSSFMVPQVCVVSPLMKLKQTAFMQETCYTGYTCHEFLLVNAGG